ncbi:chemotaxis protein CheW [Maritalea sp.]|jgi:two-component system chemotaxis sensor kinase CheA|uniref:chemotaxis protein CheA n=1 Tax=Maritalea sp. TaxID=2003361 RepID=UPI0039E50AD8
MSELDEFKATYFDECSELLAELEEQFLAIEAGDKDPERLHAVFRAIHSIKGGAGAFGFSALVSFSHSFETLLDFVRDGRIELDPKVLTLCIRSSDLIADFVAAAQENRELEEGYGAEQKAAFEALCNPDGTAEDDEDFDIEFTPVMAGGAMNVLADDEDVFENAPLNAGTEGDLTAALDDAEDDLSDADVVFAGDGTDGAPEFGAAADAWTLTFTPLPALFERANDPLLLFRELSIVGDSQVNADIREIPELNDFEPFQPYCQWVITLKGDDVTEERIREVFEFVEGDCEIEVTPPGELSERQTSILVGEIGSAADQAVPNQEPVAAPEPVESIAVEADTPSFADLAGELGVDMNAEPEPEIDVEAEDEPELEVQAQTAPVPLVAPVSDEDTSAASSDGPGGLFGNASAKNKAADKAPVQSIRVDLDKVDRVVNMVGELVITQSMLTQQMDETLRDKYQELVRGIEVLAQTTRGLQDSVMAIRAQPVKSVFSRMPRLVRELASKTGKKIKLEMVGENTEIDKTVIEQLSDPLTHMIRNSADHGIETCEKRKERRKPEQGTITLSAEQAGGNILIIVEDDGAGINRERVLALAKEKGVVPQDQTPTDEQIDNLIFAPGFSTVTEVSDLSGRGVGMDVVLSNIKKIGGSVHVRSTPGRGTRMTLRLPLTLAVLDVMLVSVAGCPYVVPLSSIVETIQAGRAEFGKVPSGSRLLQIRGEYVPVVDLATRFAMHTDAEEKNRFVVLCEAEGTNKLAIIVDEIIGQQQVVIKSLEENYERIDGIAGGTILGNGQVALIVDVQGLKTSRVNHRSAAA